MTIFSDMVGLWTLWKADHISCDGLHHPCNSSRLAGTIASDLECLCTDDCERPSILHQDVRGTVKKNAHVIWHFAYVIFAFPTDRVVSCYFHFVKNCYSNAIDLGLKKHLAKDAELRKWLRTLIGGVHLSNDQQAIMWDHLLQNPPVIPERANLTRFMSYFRRQWHTDAARALINQHENRGPRTTNISEG
ncbi:hypothetical protein DdX_22340 [Ditylenchus destructor]|uniref:MULE transposase domain-containing protein n=1 Tax=Ditylenchus destructor TaxID=166010 RepID=A0AAD4QSJ8_9BILA|nr:hypothetical protein DdX_22340 [Ditylenchus destructor]